jgi:hypothetical protein
VPNLLNLHIPDNVKEHFKTAVESVIKGYERAGLFKFVKNLPKFNIDPRKSGDEGANGHYDIKTDTITILYPQINHTDITFAIAHELAHKLWHKLSKEEQALWKHTVEAIGKRLPDEMIAHNINMASINGRTPLWFWYKCNIDNNIEGFKNYLATRKYAPSNFPRAYSNASPDEAWADVVANLILGRSHNRNLMSKTGSIPAKIAAKLINKVKCESEEKLYHKKEPAKGKFVIPKSVIFGDEPNQNVLSSVQ